MQFYLDKFRTGDPEVFEPNPNPAMLAHADALPEEVDVLIVGCGPAGLTLAAQLARFPEIKTRIVEQKPGPLQIGQADGIACRSMEMFQAFGMRERVEREAYWVNETAFWKPSLERPGEIVRSGLIQDVEDGLAPYPHVIINQARVHQFFLDIMAQSPNRLVPNYNRRFAGMEIGAQAVTARIERLDAAHKGEIETVKARYVVGADGARSSVRDALGFKLVGDYANQAWGVMDVLAVTDFPDIRKKCVIQSEREGNVLVIPREGGYMLRIYVEMDKLAENERVTNRAITLDDIVGAAKRIFRPYAFEAKSVSWWSVYEVGQRITDHFDDASPTHGARDPRVFIMGDACHTHSAKAGQGLNVSVQDAFNLGWKLAAVLRGRADASLLSTYSAERRAIAQNLIDFDREWSAMMAAPLKSPQTPHGVDPADLQSLFRPARALYRGRRDPLSAFRADGRSRASGARQGVRGRDALPFRAGRAARRRQGDRTHRDDGGRRPLPPDRLRRPRRTRGARLENPRALRIPRRNPRIRPCADTPRRRGRRCGDRPARRCSSRTTAS